MAAGTAEIPLLKLSSKTRRLQEFPVSVLRPKKVLRRSSVNFLTSVFGSLKEILYSIQAQLGL